MVDTVNVLALKDDADEYIVQMTNVSDGTGENKVTKVDASALSASRFRVKSILFSTVGMGFKLEWAADTDVLLIEVAADKSGGITYPTAGRPEPDPAWSGLLGDILLTTVGHAAGDTYSIVLNLEKVA